jgi:hypothetical protein
MITLKYTLQLEGMLKILTLYCKLEIRYMQMTTEQYISPWLFLLLLVSVMLISVINS